MRQIAFCLFILLFAPAASSAQEDANPYLSAKVGDWGKYEMTTGTDTVIDFRIVTKVQKNIVSVSRRFGGPKGTEVYSFQVDTSKPLPNLSLAGFRGNPIMKSKTLESGKETLNVCGKNLDSKFIQIDIEIFGSSQKPVAKIWRSSNLPLDGVVKRIFFDRGTVTQTLLVDYGWGKAAPPLPKKPRTEVSKPNPKLGGASTKEKEMTNSIGMEFVLQEAGEFLQGAQDRKSFFDTLASQKTKMEKLDLLTLRPPQVAATIDHPFWIGKTEVTIGQFRKFIRGTGYPTTAERPGGSGSGLTSSNEFEYRPDFDWENYGFHVSDKNPVANVSHKDAVEFCRWLSKKERKTYRLPTETEWEFACRGGTTTEFAYGDGLASLKGKANVADQSLKRSFDQMGWAVDYDDKFVFTAPVGSFDANEIGLFDMHGNVLEWTATVFSFYEPIKNDLAKIPAEEFQYVARGGNWFNEPARAGAACRIGMSPETTNSLTGFRIVLESSP